MADFTIGDMLGRLSDVRQTGRGKWQAICPAHEDRNPSLSISEGDGGKPLLYCHAGCAYPDIMAALGLSGHPSANGNGANSVAATSAKPKAQTARRIVATYDYRDAAGQVIFQKVRYGPEKSFAVRRPDGRGGYTWNLGDIAPVLYCLPGLIDPAADWQPVYIPEGEKDVDRLVSLDLVATCNFDGAAKAGQKPKWRPEYNEHFAGRVVYILADNDDAGRAHSENVARNLSGIARCVKVIALPDLPDKGDVSDWLDAGHGKDELERICLMASAWEPTEKDADEDGATAGKGTAVLKSNQYIDSLRSLGYTFKLNELDDTVEVNGKPISDVLRAKIFSQMADLGFKGMERVEHVYTGHAYDNRYHPIADYLSDLKWDGRRRLAEFLNHLVIADETMKLISQIFIRRWMLGAVGKVLN